MRLKSDQSPSFASLTAQNTKPWTFWKCSYLLANLAVIGFRRTHESSTETRKISRMAAYYCQNSQKGGNLIWYWPSLLQTLKAIWKSPTRMSYDIVVSFTSPTTFKWSPVFHPYGKLRLETYSHRIWFYMTSGTIGLWIIKIILWSRTLWWCSAICGQRHFSTCHYKPSHKPARGRHFTRRLRVVLLTIVQHRQERTI